MKSLILFILLVGTYGCSDAYNYQRTSSYHSTSSSSGSGSANRGCCKLSPWANQHMEVVQLMADQLRQAYNSRSRGQAARYSYSEWSDDFANSIGKSTGDINALTQKISEQIVSDMHAGRLSYGEVAQPNFFEFKAADALEKISGDAEFINNQQKQVNLYEPSVPHVVSAIDLSKFDDVQHYNYPTEVKVVNGQTIITNKNCTTATMHGGSDYSPIVRTVRVNRTTTHSTVPYYTQQGSPYYNSQVHNVYRHFNKEGTVPNYSPQVTVDDNLGSTRLNQMNNHYTPPILIPVEEGYMSGTQGIGNQYAVRPDSTSTVTVRKYNKKIITGSDGKPIISGSQSESVWDNGLLVYNYSAPFGNTNWSKDDLWKREEREKLFWLFQDGIINTNELAKWQAMQEDRLLALAYRSNRTLEEIEEWQRQELERYNILVNQYSTNELGLTDWQKRERGRIDWLIHQNGISREELERWQNEYNQKLAILAAQYQVSIEELKAYHRQELNRLHMIFNQQNSQLSSNSLSKAQIFQNQERDRLNSILLQHNSTVDNLKEQIRRDQDRYKNLAQQYQISVKDQEAFFKNELERLTKIINQQQEEMKRITNWQRSERSRLEDIIRHHNLTVSELEEKMKHDRIYLQALAQKYHISMEELENWQRSELDRLHETGKVNLQKELEEWQKQERDRMLAIIKKNDLTIEDYESKIGNDRARLQQLASTYQIQVEEIEKWLKEEAQRLKNEGVFSEVQKNLTIWQQQERDRLQAIVQNNELTIEELQNKINRDQNRLYTLANTYQVRVEEVEDWLKKEILRLQSQGLVKHEDLQDWQKIEREKILQLVEANKLSVEDYEKRLLNDKSYLQQLAKQYHVELKDIETWLRKESDRLQSLGLIEEEKLTEWQKIERERLLNLIQKNELSIEDVEKKIEADQVHLYSLAHRYSVRVEEIEKWLKNEIQRLQNQQILESASLKDWQRAERDRIMIIVKQNDLTIDEFIQKIKTDRAYLQQLSRQYNIRIEEIEEWVRYEANRLESLGLIRPNADLTEWQKLERDHVMQVVQGDNQLSLDELEERLKNDRTHLVQMAQDYQVQVQDIEEWIRKELQRLQNQGFVQIEKLKQWQQTERDHLTALIAQQQDGFSVDEFERQLKTDRQRLQNLAYQNNVQVKEIEEWIHKELERMRTQGQEKINNLTEWQKNERDRLLTIFQQNSNLSAAELEKELQADRNRLQSLAWQYHVEVEEVEEFIRKEIQRLREQGSTHIENLTSWQIDERQRLQNLIQAQSHLSVEEVEKQLIADRNRLQQLATQYHIQVEEVETWIRKEADRLRNQGQVHIESLSTWQENERKRIQELILKNNDLTYEDLQWQLKADQGKLEQLAQQYHVSIEEIEAWIKTELLRLRNEGKLEIEHLNVWQKAEKERLLQLAKEQHKLTLMEFEEKLSSDRRRLETLAQQYHISVEEIEEWIKKEAERLENQGTIGNLKEWQKLERFRIHDMLKQSNLTIEEFEEQLKKDFSRLQELAFQYHITVEEVEEWILKEGSRQIGHEALWKINEKDRLKHLVRSQDLTVEELERTIKNDRDRINKLSVLYHVTVEEIEEYIRSEGKRLLQPATLTAWQVDEQNRILQQIHQPRGLTIEELENNLKTQRYRLHQISEQHHITIEEILEWIRKEGRRLIKMSPWQQHEREYLRSLVDTKLVTKKTNLEDRLFQDTQRMENVAAHFQVSIEEIKDFVRKEYQRLIQQNLVSDGEDTVQVQVKQWEGPEKQHIENLLHEHTWSIEELERELFRDKERLQQLAYQYHVTVDEIEEWYRSELQKLLQENRLQSENLTEWQKREKNRLFTTISLQHISINELERQLQSNPEVLKRLAGQYRITLDQLIEWQNKELRRLSNLGYGNLIESASLKNWQLTERKRLRMIPDKIIITRQELLEFFESDRLFQNNLTANYEVPMKELFSFQSQELQAMENEGLLESLNLNHLEDWQGRERDRLYSLIRTQSFSSKQLPAWQTDDKTTRIAATYNLPAYIVRNWQKQEIERIEKVANHYRMSLNVLEDFRFRELERLLMINHQSYLPESVYNAWEKREQTRMRSLMARTGLSESKIDKWRRKLFLLAQGLIDLDFNEGGYGGIELSSSSSTSAKRNETISSDRGDQPPQVFQEFEDSEPSLGYTSDTMPTNLIESYNPPPPTYLPTEEDKSYRGHYSGHPAPTVLAPMTNYPPQTVQNTYTQKIHRKKEYSFTSPGVQDSNYQNRYSFGRGSPEPYPYRHGYDHAQNADASDMGQQTQVENWNPYSDDPGQQSEQLEDLNAKVDDMGQQTEDLGQQLQQENLGELTNEDDQQILQETFQHAEHIPLDEKPAENVASVEAGKAAEKIVVAEHVTEKPKSIWNKAKSWFG